MLKGMRSHIRTKLGPQKIRIPNDGKAIKLHNNVEGFNKQPDRHGNPRGTLNPRKKQRIVYNLGNLHIQRQPLKSHKMSFIQNGHHYEPKKLQQPPQRLTKQEREATCYFFLGVTNRNRAINAWGPSLRSFFRDAKGKACHHQVLKLSLIRVAI